MTDAAGLLADTHWVRANSRWRYWTWTLFFTWVAFMWSGMRAHRPRWVALGFAYAVPFIVFCITDTSENAEDTVLYNVTMGALFATWPITIIHARHLLPRYLAIRAGIEATTGTTVGAQAAFLLDGSGARPAAHEHPVVADAQQASAGYVAGRGAGGGGSPLSRWRSPEHPSEPEARRGPPVDLNRAGAAEIAELPGIGVVLAKRAVALRDARGEFASVDAFGAALDLKPHVIERLRPFAVAEVSPVVERSAGRVIDF